jgi:cell division protein FtsI/penicillin-binding protein 2
MRRKILVVALGALLVGAAAVACKSTQPDSNLFVTNQDDPSAKLSSSRATPAEPSLPSVAGLDLLRISVDGNGASAPAAEDRTVRLTIDPELQRTAIALMSAHHLPEAAVVMIDTATGHVLVYASYVDHGPARDLCAEATAPSASVFKIITGSTLVEEAHLTAETTQCYNGGGSERLLPADLADDPKRDKYCVSLTSAMGRSLNPVFAKLAQKHLKPAQIDAMARRFGYGEPVPFDVPTQPAGVNIPQEPLEFARTAAGFWNTTLSPMQAAWISTTIARGGEAVRPLVVKEIHNAQGEVLYTSPAAPVVRRAVKPETAQAITTMMEYTVSDGTSFRAFHDEKHKPFIPNIAIAGKTGTLTDQQQNRFYTWFTGFAPSKPLGDVRTVAIAVLVVNNPNWTVKANVVARDMLRAYFAQQNVPNVTKPSPSAIARHKEDRKAKKTVIAER